MKFRKSISALVTMMRVGKYLSYAGKELDTVMEINNYSQKDYDEGSSQYSEARKTYDKLANIVCNAIGGDVYDSAEKEFFNVLNDKEATKSYFGVETIENPKEVFEKVFYLLKEQIDVSEETDDYLLWLSLAEEIITASNTEEVKQTSMCETCNCFIDKVPAELVLGEGTALKDIYYCQSCGSYAKADKNGCLIGSLADKETHNKRGKAKNAVLDMSKNFGLLYPEALRYFEKIVGVKLRKFEDIEKLDSSKCQILINSYIELKETLKNQKYPKNHKELMKFLAEGGRLRVIQSLDPQKNNRLLIPVYVGDGVMMVRGAVGNERVLLPSVLKYKFNKNKMEIVHPNKTEYFLLYNKL